VTREALGQYEEVTLHGHRVGFQTAGDGPLLVLLHGITSEAWREVMPRLAERYTVVAPDLIGHGRSAKPRGDYSLGAHAAGVRDLLALLGFESGTVVGHSLGGGIAMQFSYLFPEYVERMALISSGGLGQEVHPLLRAATLPGSEWVLPLLAREWSVRSGCRLDPTSPSSPAGMPRWSTTGHARRSSTRCGA
jgi:pimeloyl-ACP methyl ester carboxylesterase